MIGKFKLNSNGQQGSKLQSYRTVEEDAGIDAWGDNGSSKGNGEVKKKRVRKSKKQSPEDIIALDDDDFGDF